MCERFLLLARHSEFRRPLVALERLRSHSIYLPADSFLHPGRVVMQSSRLMRGRRRARFVVVVAGAGAVIFSSSSFSSSSSSSSHRLGATEHDRWHAPLLSLLSLLQDSRPLPPVEGMLTRASRILRPCCEIS